MRGLILLAGFGLLAACQPLTPEEARALQAYAAFSAQQQANQPPIYRPMPVQPMRPVSTQTFCNRIGDHVYCNTY